jgi:hypothetical protein
LCWLGSRENREEDKLFKVITPVTHFLQRGPTFHTSHLLPSQFNYKSINGLIHGLGQCSYNHLPKSLLWTLYWGPRLQHMSLLGGTLHIQTITPSELELCIYKADTTSSLCTLNR